MVTVLDVVREAQLLVLAVILLPGAAAKLLDRSPRGQGPAVLLPIGWRRPATLAHGAAEGVLALALLGAWGIAGDAARIGAALLFAGGAAALVVLRRSSPETGCGCFGGLSTTPVDWRSIARSGLLAVSALAAIGVPSSAAGVAAGATLGHAGVLALEAVLIGALSPELVELARRAARPVPCAVREIPVQRTLARLRASDVWRSNAAVVEGTEPLDVWRQGCWRFAVFPGRRSGRPVDVVFGIPLEGRRPAIRAVITDRETGEVLYALGGLADSGRGGRPRRQAPAGVEVQSVGDAVSAHGPEREADSQVTA
ncbi:MauE/DoxX family redox-associated membrane protein [Streptomonospora sp. PA3]|uniref:MauE/DoxX family redox-associated membrane protein n=1 Tax=Streptomonospora sp. PA3 TaxID=2607326 RepID=UPI001642A12D|nr:MauE/DoxX family redox-associated membrane protein [Streptomonospora sp. PA3]